MSQMRASTAERQAYADLLATAYADGRLDYDEFHRRQDALYQATTHAEMQGLFEGLPYPGIDVREPAEPEPAAATSGQPRPSRRGLFIAGGVGLAGLLGAITYVSWHVGYSAHLDREAMWMEATMPPVSIENVDLMASVLAEMKAQGLDLVYSLEVQSDYVMGELGSTRLPNIQRGCHWDGTVIIAEPEPTSYNQSLPLDVLESGLKNAKATAKEQLGIADGEEPVTVRAAANRFEVAYGVGTITLTPEGEVSDVRWVENW